MKLPALNKYLKWLAVIVAALTLLLVAACLITKYTQIQSITLPLKRTEVSQPSAPQVNLVLEPQSRILPAAQESRIDIMLDTQGEVISGFQIYYLLTGDQVNAGWLETDSRLSYLINSAQYDAELGGTLLGISAYNIEGIAVDNTSVGQLVFTPQTAGSAIKFKLVDDLTKVVRFKDGDLLEIFSIDESYKVE